MLEHLTKEERALLSNKNKRLQLLEDTDVFRAVRELLRAVGGVEHRCLDTLASLVVVGQTTTYQHMAGPGVLNQYSGKVFSALYRESERLYGAAVSEAIARRREAMGGST